MRLGLARPRKIVAPAARRLLGTIIRISTREPLVAITFDDGPDPYVTPRLLDVLREHGAHATFFMVGEAAERYPDLVRKVAEDGHAIGNHSWDHSSFRLLSGKERRAGLRACDRAIAPYGEPLFRPPYGEQSLLSRLDALRLGYSVVTWSLCAHDWHGERADSMADRLKKAIRPGDIVLFHDSLFAPRGVDERSRDREPTLRAVEMLLEQCHGSLRFVTIPELMHHGRPDRRLWFWPVAARSTDISQSADRSDELSDTGMSV